MTDLAEEPQALLFIVDEPAEVDALNVHDRIADAIVDVVCHQPQIKMIGLLGGWGSGKSTVIKLMEGKLEGKKASPTIRCFVYDTWLRQSDPPRRAFLEGLASFLTKDDVSSSKNSEERWKIELAELTGHFEKTSTESKAILTVPGRFMLPAIVLLPVGLKLIGDGTLAYEERQDLAAIIVFILGWVLTFAPFIAAILIKIFGKYAIDDILVIFANKPGEQKQEIKSRRPEPTAIEFQEMFRKILESMPGAGRDLVIVIDNLDRLPPEEAVTLWATMRGFFLDARRGGLAIGSDLPAVIVPIDPSASERIHGRAVEGNAGSLSESFISKTFDLVFRVPPPVLSSWQKYLESRLRAVFRRELQPSWPFQVRLIYEAFHRQKGPDAQVTPRDLNTFVNAIATLWIQWRDSDISMASIAYFVCHRVAITKDIHNAVQHPIVSLDSFDLDWRLSIAALSFGVPKAQASELYMKDPIRSAISSEDPSTFRKLATDPGFDLYFDQVLDDPSAFSVMAAARVLDQADLTAEAWADNAWRRLREQAPGSLGAHAIRAADDEALSLLVASAPTNVRWAFLQSLAAMFLSAPPEHLLENGGKFTAAFVQRLVEESEALGEFDLVVNLPPNGMVYLWLLSHELTTRAKLALRTNQSWDTIINDLQAMLRQQQASTLIAASRAAVAWADIVPKTIEWQPVLDVIATNLQSEDVTRATTAVVLHCNLYSRLEIVRQRVAMIQSQGLFQSTLQRLWGSFAEGPDVEDAVGALIALQIQHKSFPETPDRADWKTALEQRPGLAGRVDIWLRTLSGDDGVESLWRLFIDHPGGADLIRGIAKSRAPRVDTDAAAAKVMASLTEYLQLLPAAGTFWRELSGTPGFWSAVAGLDLSISTPLYKLLASAEGPKSQLGKQLKARLEEVSSEQWTAAIEQGADPFPLIYELNLLPQSTITIGGFLVGALEAALATIVAGGDPARRARWFAFVQRTHSAARRSLLRRVASAILVQDQVEDLVQLLTAGGLLLLGKNGLNADPRSAALKLIPSLLATGDGIEWLAAHAAETRPWVLATTAPIRSQLRAQIETLTSSHHASVEIIQMTWFGGGDL
ncbi:MAG: hypothetical protein JWR80_5830 [Bradyrhizobium sp.]|nr:hypothetical protein [Bradyrhizobium sp.]